MFYLDIIFNNDKTFITYDKNYYTLLPHSIAYSFIKHIDLDNFLLKSYNYIFFIAEYILLYNETQYCILNNSIKILNVYIDTKLVINKNEITNIKLVDEFNDFENQVIENIKHTKILIVSTM
ncbi:hypothetical protein IOLA_300 [uncultured bacterium]|nr:hypothetical protein IOLA_300 [uncultured bacterium]